MTIYGLVVAPRAQKDIASIYNHIARDSTARAESLVARIRAQFVSIQEAPHRNIVQSQPSGLPVPVRSTPLKPYMIYFRVNDTKKTVRILRVRHGARRPLRRFD